MWAALVQEGVARLRQEEQEVGVLVERVGQVERVQLRVEWVE